MAERERRPLDVGQMNRNVETLLTEVRQLREALDEAEPLFRAAALEEVDAHLAEPLRALAAVDAQQGESAAVVEAFRSFLAAHGLVMVKQAGQILELWPEQASLHLDLDREVPATASLVRVEVLAPGWSRGERVVARPVGRVVEVVE